MSYTIVNTLIEFSLDGENWGTYLAPPLKEIEGWRKFLPGADHRQRTSYRLVKRTAVITDEVLDTDPRIGDCYHCGLAGVEVIPAKIKDYFMCADAAACRGEYDRITEDEGWLG